jgi:hypothetical protein
MIYIKGAYRWVARNIQTDSQTPPQTASSLIRIKSPATVSLQK